MGRRVLRRLRFIALAVLGRSPDLGSPLDSLDLTGADERSESERESDRAFIRAAYPIVFQREADESGVDFWDRRLARGLWRRDMVRAMVHSEEFTELGSEPLHDRLHRARMEWIGGLPGADTLLDIGGSSPTCPDGALSEMGWTGRPERIVVVDLPPDEQYHGRPVYSQEGAGSTGWGGEISYVHSHAEDLHKGGALEGETFGAVFMGQSIEHVEVDAVPGLLAWIRRHIADDGWLALDTPNRAVTRFQCPDRFTDPDHETEYEPAEMTGLLRSAGFRVTAAAGIMPCPATVAESRWQPLETFTQPLVDEDPSTGWAFGVVAVPVRAADGGDGSSGRE